MRLHNSWDNVLQNEFDSPYFKQIVQTVLRAYGETTVYPPKGSVFNAFKLTELDKVKCVILGQDPYYGAGQAMGLSFSVPSGVRLPPTLVNIYKEMLNDLEGMDYIQSLNVIKDMSGDLTAWAKEGVLLLNSSLTVLAGKANSHQDIWQPFTDKVIKAISDNTENVVFVLWGNYAKSKKIFIDADKHCILESVHPSPLSVYGHFYGSKPFSKTNAYLTAHGKTPIDWLKIK